MQRTRRFLGTLTAGLVLAASVLGISASPAVAQVELTKESYIQPPSPILESVTAPWHTNVSLRNMNPDGVRFLLPTRDGMTPLEALANPHLRLAESDYEHEAQRSRRLYTRSDSGLDVFNAETGETKSISIPGSARVSNATWSPDGTQVAFFAHFPEATHIYMAYADSGESRQLTPRPVVATHVTNYEWTADGKHIVTVLSPESEQVSMPVASPVATEPIIRTTRDGETPSRTYRYLLQSPYEMELLEYLSTGQVAMIDVDSGKVKNIGEPDMIRGLNADPSGSFFRITMLKRPFSYFVPLSSFGSKEVLVNADGDVLHTFSDRELREGGRRTARPDANDNDDDDEEREPPKRDVRWRPGVKGMSFLQAVPEEKDDEEAKDDDGDDQDANQGRRGRGGRATQQGRRGRGGQQPQGRGGNQGQEEGEGNNRPQGPDRVMLWKPPFGEDDVEVVYESPRPIRSVQYSQDGRWMFVTRTAGRNQQTIHAVDLQDVEKEYQVFRGRGGGAAAAARGRFARGRGQSFDPDARAMDWYAWDELADETWARAGSDTPFEQDGQDDRKQGDDQQDDAKKDDQKQDGDKQDADAKKDDQGDDAKDDDQDGDTKADDDDADDGQDDDQDAEKENDRGVSRGSLMTDTSPDGERVVRVSPDGEIYFNRTKTDGDEEEEEDQDDDADQDEEAEPAERSIVIEKVNIVTGEVEGIFSSEPTSEMTVSFVDAGGTDGMDHFYTSRQNTETPPNFYMYKKGKDGASQLTDNKNFTPWFQNLETERFQVTRVDGFKFWVRVTKNPDHGEKLPAMFWFYPREYTSQEAYDRSSGGGRGRGGATGGPGRFRQPSSRSMAHLTQLGYVIVEPDMPIVGEEGRMNDNFVQDLRNGLWAVIDELDKRRLIDRDRLGIGGHSYGAFGTANAMAHTPFFKAGIAGDGNYNRTLTPMAFQSERRFFWDAREVYTSMSPFFWANQINGALLMYHGAEDANVGTHPIHSERMFHVLDGLGKTAAMYMYPYEDHGPIGKETTLDLWARWVGWLDKYVKNPAEPEEEAEAESEEGVAEDR